MTLKYRNIESIYRRSVKEQSRYAVCGVNGEPGLFERWKHHVMADRSHPSAGNRRALSAVGGRGAYAGRASASARSRASSVPSPRMKEGGGMDQRRDSHSSLPNNKRILILPVLLVAYE